MTKHFVKTLIIFIAMIILGLIGVFLTSYFNKVETVTSNPSTSRMSATKVAK